MPLHLAGISACKLFILYDRIFSYCTKVKKNMLGLFITMCPIKDNFTVNMLVDKIKEKKENTKNYIVLSKEKDMIHIVQNFNKHCNAITIH